MRKTLTLILCVLLILSSASCGKKETEPRMKAEITLDRTEYITGDTIKISVKTEGLDPSSSPWVGIAPYAEYASGDELDGADIWYAYITGDEQDFEAAPDPESGRYIAAVISSDSDDGGKILAAAEFSFTRTEVITEDPDGAGEDNDEGRNEQAGKYGISACPFYIRSGGNRKQYFFRGGGELCDWVYTEENTDGWYLYNGLVISADGKYAIGPGADSLSSFCEYEAHPYDGEVLTQKERNASRDGVLYVTNSYTPIAANRGIALTGDGETASPERSCTDIRCSFTAGENICIYITLETAGEPLPAEVYVIKHDDMYVYGSVISAEMKAQAVTGTIFTGSSADNGPAARISISQNALEGQSSGRFDLVFVYDELIVCRTVITVTE